MTPVGLGMMYYECCEVSSLNSVLASAGTMSGLNGDPHWSEHADPGDCFKYKEWLFFNSNPGRARKGRRPVCKAAVATASPSTSQPIPLAAKLYEI